MKIKTETLKNLDTVIENLEKEFQKQENYTEKELMLHNDDKNSFDHVIINLMKFCKHNSEQAQQCALIAHHKGKCVIKKGGSEELTELKKLFKNVNVIVTIE